MFEKLKFIRKVNLMTQKELEAAAKSVKFGDVEKKYKRKLIRNEAKNRGIW